jgi:pyridoxal phosphate enzyme (YggS family)
VAAPLDRLDPERRAELVSALAAVRSRLVDAATSVGRDGRSVTLIAITKTFPASDVAILAGLGLLDVGENRDQEARRKHGEVATLAARLGVAVDRLRWHFVGQLQTNKARSVVRYCTAVHSVDRAPLVTALAEAVARAERGPLDVFLQVRLDGEPGRGGAAPAAVPGLAESVLARPELRLCGVMAVAPLGGDPDAAFAQLARISAELRRVAPEATSISAGMSGDLEQAVRHGATHVRVGSALLGHRSPVVG